MGTCLNSFLYQKVVDFVSGSFVVIFSQLIPIFNLCFTYIFKLDRINSIQDFKAIIQIIGVFISSSCALMVIIIGYRTPTETVTKADWIYASVIGISNSISFSIYHILQTKLFYRNKNSYLRNKPFTINAYCTIFGTLLYCFFAVPYSIIKKDTIISSLSLISLLPILYSSILLTFVCYSLVIWCNRNSSPILLGTSCSLEVILSLTLLRIFTDERMYLLQYFCFIGVVLGMLIVVLTPTF
ncbi:hypothetical protein MXB_2333 [Myxobolus squamalis]|nr:hypothetical protein MXB_2333 [Myxobolus squamalis]